jgi:hypothetical protein
LCEVFFQNRWSCAGVVPVTGNWREDTQALVLDTGEP